MAEIFSTCGKKKYAAILVDSNNHIVGAGYNGGPSGFTHCADGGCPRLTQDSEAGSIYDNCIAIHAEQNALLHSDYSSNAKRMYVNGPPCFTCAKLIANSTIENIYYLSNKEYKDWNSVYTFLINSGVSITEINQWQLEN